ncbi:MAG: hypothetical protein ACK4UP_06325 [Spirosomataceae bacterium]
MSGNLILPLPHLDDDLRYSQANKTFVEIINSWIDNKILSIREVWTQNQLPITPEHTHTPAILADEILQILTHRIFNYQSKKNLTQVITKVKLNLEKQIANGSPIRIFFLYNGGYRASPFSGKQSLIYEPDQTELMLLFQITLLKQKIATIYPHGIEFFIVINNGVALWTNEIPLFETEKYANRMRGMIQFLGAEGDVHILVQSELPSFNPNYSFTPSHPRTKISEQDHLNVERFLGRTCSYEEASFRFTTYLQAEAKWAEDLSSIVTAKDALIMRQVAHPDMLSFRPFPGGAIRTQNGSLGFEYHNDKLIPKLITSKTLQKHTLERTLYKFPITSNTINTNLDE